MIKRERVRITVIKVQREKPGQAGHWQDITFSGEARHYYLPDATAEQTAQALTNAGFKYKSAILDILDEAAPEGTPDA